MTGACQYRPSAALRHKAETASFKKTEALHSVETSLHHLHIISDSTSKQPTVTLITVVPFLSNAALLLLQNKARDLIEPRRHQLPALTHIVKRSKTDESHYFLHRADLCRPLLQSFKKTEEYYKPVYFFFCLVGLRTKQNCSVYNPFLLIGTELRYTARSRCFGAVTTHVCMSLWASGVYKYTPKLFLWPAETFYREGE